MRESTRTVGALALAVALATPASAQDVSDLDRFSLYDDCEPMRLVIEDLSDDAAAIDLTEARIRTLVESRLRAARLFTTNPLVANFESPVRPRVRAYLYVSVLVVQTTFASSVRYEKSVEDVASGVTRETPTWAHLLAGNSDEGGYVVQAISEQIDKFILEYLRVNEAAC